MSRGALFGMREGTLVAYKNPSDWRAPYHVVMTLPGGRDYEGRLRQHPITSGEGFWYEGFVTAVDPIVYARDETLKRYPVAPDRAPEKWDLLPCQMKLNPYPAGYANYLRSDLIGEVWVSGDNPQGPSVLYTARLNYRQDVRIAFDGIVERYGSRMSTPDLLVSR